FRLRRGYHSGCRVPVKPAVPRAERRLRESTARPAASQMNALAQIMLPTYTIDEVLSPYVYVFYVAFFVAFIFTPVMRRVATYFNIIDQPDLVRKMHSRPVAYLGGVAVFLGW